MPRASAFSLQSRRVCNTCFRLTTPIRARCDWQAASTSSCHAASRRRRSTMRLLRRTTTAQSHWTRASRPRSCARTARPLRASLAAQRLLPPPFSAELLAAAARFVPGARCLCLIVVGALAPLCFLFSVFQNARPPATPRWLGPPLTQRSKNVGLPESLSSSSVLAAADPAEDRTLLMGNHQSLCAVKLYQPK